MPISLASGTLPNNIRSYFPDTGFPSALAPMQDVTGLPFMSLISDYGPPDLFFTEYFRVHSHARIDPAILSSITENPSGRPVFAQLIGEDLEHISRFAKELQKFPIAGIDLNLGCPAPRVYRKNVGGGLLRDPARIDRILNILRETCECPLTVKTRIGFEDTEKFTKVLDVFSVNKIDLLSLHARTVRGGYRMVPQYEYVKVAASRLDCPVLLNGEVNTAQSAINLVNSTGADGVMIGRSAIRNPWIFLQIKQLHRGEEMTRPTLGDLNNYIQKLYEVLSNPDIPEEKQVARLKKFLNFIGLSVDKDGQFLYHIRRAKNRTDLNLICDKYLLGETNENKWMSLTPHAQLSVDEEISVSSCRG